MDTHPLCTDNTWQQYADKTDRHRVTYTLDRLICHSNIAHCSKLSIMDGTKYVHWIYDIVVVIHLIFFRGGLVQQTGDEAYAAAKAETLKAMKPWVTTIWPKSYSFILLCVGRPLIRCSRLFRMYACNINATFLLIPSSSKASSCVTPCRINAFSSYTWLISATFSCEVMKTVTKDANLEYYDLAPLRYVLITAYCLA